MALLFVLPLLQRNLHIWKFKELKGEHSPHTKPSITLQTWLDGTYQKRMDQYCVDSFGFQSPLVRGINQLDYTCFNQANAQYVIIGKQDYLYETPYIEAHLGIDYIGDSAIKIKLKKYQAVHDTLKKLGINLTMVFAPGKGSFYPEYIPDYYWQYKSNTNNYEKLRDGFNALQLPFIDFSAWFLSMKETTEAPLVPRTGIHWSKYGMLLATDSILSYWDKNYDGQLPRLTFDMPDTTTTITQGSDADVEDGLNIILTLPHFEMVYPQHHIVKGTRKIRSAVIADSYYWGLFDIGLSTVACDSGEFWYYFKQVYPQNFSSGLMIDDVDLQNSIETKNEIVLLQTDATLDRFGFGFIEAAYNLYYNPK